MVERVIEIPTWRTALVREGAASFRVDTPDKAAEVLRQLIGDRAQETVAVIALDYNYAPVAATVTNVGGTAQVPLDISAVLRFVLLTGAPGFIVGHNHPFGSAEPSEDDIQSSRRLQMAAKITGLELVDVLIIDADSLYPVSLRVMRRLTKDSAWPPDGGHPSNDGPTPGWRGVLKALWRIAVMVWQGPGLSVPPRPPKKERS